MVKSVIWRGALILVLVLLSPLLDTRGRQCQAGTLLPGRMFPVGGNTFEFGVGDFNGDEILDLVSGTLVS